MHFSRAPIEFTGTPKLTLDVGGGATKDINWKTIIDDIITFHYTVEAGHNIDDLDFSAVDALTGTITSWGTDVDLTLPNPASANSLAGQKKTRSLPGFDQVFTCFYQVYYQVFPRFQIPGSLGFQ